MKTPYSIKGYASWHHYTPAQMQTKGLSLRQAANKAGIRCQLGFENVYLNGIKTHYGEAREIIGTKLLTHEPSQ